MTWPGLRSRCRTRAGKPALIVREAGDVRALAERVCRLLGAGD